ncbi:MAG TPA: peptidase domain-containing ABC transporter [Chitinophagaceae bacterium]|nr:peptidase domain-containing ABC transporter [Chitinophagaceae bacterium]
MKFPFYKQFDSMDCGPACLQMVAKYYRKNVLIEDIREMCEITREGVNLLGISNSAEQLGFKSRCVKTNINELDNNLLPAILHWNQDHFVVLYKVKSGSFYIADPARGKIILDEQEFKQHWCGNSPEGIALLLETSEGLIEKNEFTGNAETIPGGNKKGIINSAKFIEYINGQKRNIGIVFLILLAVGGLQYLLPNITKNIVDKGIKARNINFLVILLLAQFSLLCGRLFFDFIKSAMLLKIGTHINISILAGFIVKLMRLPIAFFESQTKGSIMQRMQDPNRVSSFITGSSFSILFSAIMLVVFSIVLASYNIKIFFIFSIATIIYTTWISLFTSKRRQLDYKRFDLLAREQNVTMQLLEGMQEIKLFGMESSMQSIWKRIQTLLFKLNLRIFRLNQWQQMGGALINEAKNIIIIFLAANLVIQGEITLGTMMAIQMIIGQLSSPVEQFISFYQNWQNAKISMSRLNEIHRLDDEEKELQKEGLIHIQGGKRKFSFDKLELDDLVNTDFPISPIYPSISFKDVSYSYPGAGNEAVLKGITLDIPIGKTTAIVGMSGSGKTTILKLLLKYYEPQFGNITVIKCPLTYIGHKNWRSKCGVVMQDSYIFSDTIAKNIALGEDTINESQMINAVKVANIYDFIKELPLGFETKLGGEGHGISIGQRQRILIARAVYRNPEFIFFDEATNSLDTNNEKLIHDNLQEFFRNKTVVIVAHRLSTVKFADQIIVLNKGNIIEKGTHHELIDLKNEYYSLVKNQLDLSN